MRKTARRTQPKAAEQPAAPGRDEILLWLLYGWKVDKDQEARAVLHRYCEYICYHGYQEFPSTTIKRLEALSRKNAEYDYPFSSASEKAGLRGIGSDKLRL